LPDSVVQMMLPAAAGAAAGAGGDVSPASV